MGIYARLMRWLDPSYLTSKEKKAQRQWMFNDWMNRLKPACTTYKLKIGAVEYVGNINSVTGEAYIDGKPILEFVASLPDNEFNDLVAADEFRKRTGANEEQLQDFLYERHLIRNN